LAVVCLLAAFFALVAVACGGGDSTTSPGGIDAGAPDVRVPDTSMMMGGDSGPHPEHTVGGTVTGLVAMGSGVTLQNNGGDTLMISQNGSFVFPAKLVPGSTYDVTILTQPTNPSQTCTIVGGAGSIAAVDITTVVVTCTTNTYAIGGTAVGLRGSGLVLQDNGADNLTVMPQDAGNTTFTFPTKVASGGSYSVSVLAQPSTPVQTCTVTAPTGTVGATMLRNFGPLQSIKETTQ